MIVVIDNYDSFTYNLVHLIEPQVEKVEVFRNDKTTVSQLADLSPDGILISPGPGRPQDAGISMEIVAKLGRSTPILGVCLGHQAIAEQFGATIGHAKKLMHGKTSAISHDAQGIFRGLEPNFIATRYHSLVVEPESVPDELVISAWSAENVVMGIRHTSFPISGIQFHPESILTTEGPKLIQNWLDTVITRSEASR